MFIWSHNLMSNSLHYDMSRLLAEICRGLDSVFDNKRSNPVSMHVTGVGGLCRSLSTFG